LRFAPAKGAGIMVLRPRRNTLALIRETLAATLPELERDQIEGALWIVEPGRVRMHRPWDEEEDV